MPDAAQKWTKTTDGNEFSVYATPSRVIGDEAVFEVTESALAAMLTAAGFVRAEEMNS